MWMKSTGTGCSEAEYSWMAVWELQAGWSCAWPHEVAVTGLLLAGGWTRALQGSLLRQHWSQSSHPVPLQLKTHFHMCSNANQLQRMLQEFLILLLFSNRHKWDSVERQTAEPAQHRAGRDKGMQLTKSTRVNALSVFQKSLVKAFLGEVNFAGMTVISMHVYRHKYTKDSKVIFGRSNALPHWSLEIAFTRLETSWV